MTELREPRWTIEELVWRAERALQVDYWGQISGKISDLPTPRAVRFYTTLGLVDRPILRGRTGYYGVRHLMRLVAIKRLQAEGSSLVEIQNRLIGLSDDELAKIAKLPEESLGPVSEPIRLPPLISRKRTAFWRLTEAPTSYYLAAESASPAEPMVSPRAEGVPPKVETWHIVQLDRGVRLMIETDFDLDRATLREIQQAARPLLYVLQKRGILRSVSIFNDKKVSGDARDDSTDS